MECETTVCMFIATKKNEIGFVLYPLHSKSLYRTEIYYGKHKVRVILITSVLKMEYQFMLIATNKNVSASSALFPIHAGEHE